MHKLELPSAIAGTTLFTDDVLVGEDIGVTLPEVNKVTAEVTANGPMEVPITGWYEEMELTVTIKGLPKTSLALLMRDQVQHIEVRAVQDVVQPDHSVRPIGIKAFFTAIPKGIPGLGLENGEVSENELTFSVSRYELFINNERQWCIDRLNDIEEIAGNDYRGQNVQSLLY